MKVFRDKKNRIYSKAAALMLVVVMFVTVLMPADIFAEDEGLTDYDKASCSEVVAGGAGTGLYRIGQGGTTGVRMYFFHGSDAERENGGTPDGEHVYANQYGFNYNILTKQTPAGNWENYIQDSLDSTGDIEFGVFFSGPQAAWLGDRAPVEDFVLRKLSLQTEDGTVILTGYQLYDKLVKHLESIKEPGNYGSVGPARSADVLMCIPEGTLEVGTDYKLVFESGMGSSTTPLDADITFHFSTKAKQPTDISLDNSELQLTEGSSVILTATIKPVDADHKIKWESSDDDIASVDGTGTVKAVAPGTALVTATTTNGLTATCRITVIPADGKEERVIDIEEGINTIPEGLLNTRYNSAEKIIDRLREALTDECGYAADEDNSQILDIKLLISLDGGDTWREAAASDYPDNGITITLPYPEGTSGETHDYTAVHMVTYNIKGFSPGDIEIPELLETDEGLQMTVSSLSPFAVSWTEDDEDGAGESEDGSSKTGDETPIAVLAVAALMAAAATIIILRRRCR